MNPRILSRSCRLGAAVAALIAAPFAAPTAQQPTPTTHVATDSQEIALGAALAAQFDQQRGLVPRDEQDRRIEAYLQSIADSLGKHTRRKLPWTIHYDPNPGIHSGFALPGGHIVIWGGILAYMTTEDEAAAVIAHEIEHIDDDQVSGRIDSLVRTKGRDVRDLSQWNWREFGASYGAARENLCDYDGAKLMVPASYSPHAVETILGSFIALGKVHAPDAPPPHAIVVRIDQIRAEIKEFHWEPLTKTRPLKIPLDGD